MKAQMYNELQIKSKIIEDFLDETEISKIQEN